MGQIIGYGVATVCGHVSWVNAWHVCLRHGQASCATDFHLPQYFIVTSLRLPPNGNNLIGGDRYELSLPSNPDRTGWQTELPLRPVILGRRVHSADFPFFMPTAKMASVLGGGGDAAATAAATAGGTTASCNGSQKSQPGASFEDALSEGIEELLEHGPERQAGQGRRVREGARFESFTTDMDGLLAAISDGLPTPTSHQQLVSATIVLSASELDSSRKVRKKYGVCDECDERTVGAAGSSNARTSEPARETPNGRNPSREIIIIQETMQDLVGLFQEELVSGGTVEDGHPLLPPFLALIELALQHGWRSAPPSLFARPIRLWELIRRVERWSRVPEARMAIENIAQLTLLRKSSARVKAWIRLAIMGKTLAPDLTLLLNNEGPFIAQCYERWAFVRSDLFQPFLALISSLDAIDFNLFVKEAEIPKSEPRYNWRGLCEGGQGSIINFDRLSPPVPLPPILAAKTAIGSGDGRQSQHRHLPGSSQSSLPSIISRAYGCSSDDLWEQRMVAMQEDNLRLRKSLISQINQRAYFQEEYCRSQRRCAGALQEQHTLRDEIAVLQKRIRELQSVVESHEHTNEALQRQLASAFAEQEASTDQDLVRRLRSTINDLSSQLEAARALHRQEREEREQAELQLAHAKDRHERQLQDLQERLNSCELSWADRTRTLQDQLKIANCLKDEYKKRLQVYE